MSNRTAKFASAVLAGALAGVSLVGVSSGAAHAQDSSQDNCLSAPKGVAPAGNHWFYRLDHATKRHCWYLRDAKQARATPQDTATTADTAPSQDDAQAPQADATALATRRSIADAHAELQPAQAPAPQPRGNAFAGTQPAAVAADQAAAPANAPAANALDAPSSDPGGATSVVSSRWLDAAGTTTPSGSTQLASASDTAPPSNSAPAVASSPAPAPTSVPLTTADASSLMSSNPLQTMLLIVIGALAFAGLAGSIIFRFGTIPARAQRGRRDIWDAYDELPRRPAFPATAGRRPDIGIPREIQDELHLAARDDRRADNEPDDRIAEMLAQLARSART